MRLLSPPFRSTIAVTLALSGSCVGGVSPEGELAGRESALASPGGEVFRPAPTASDSLTAVERDRLLADVAILAHDSMEGRRAGSEGIQRARRYLVAELAARGIAPMDGRFERSFRFPTGGGEVEAVNLLGVVRGTEHPDEFIVVTAHYDHLGIREGEIFNGADDNASGTAALLALAARFAAEPPRHSFLFALLDAEEMGLRGAREFIADPPTPLATVLLNVNLDMVSRSELGELYAAGTHHYPFLVPLVADVAGASGARVLLGHDTPDLPSGDDWTLASDHGPFHEAGIPFLYFGVEDHAGYHAPSDDFEGITPAFFVQAVETILDFVRLADARGSEIRAASGRARP